MEKLKDVIHCEVTGVNQQCRYLRGYGNPATTITNILISGGTQDSIRTATASIPGNLPLGTRFTITIEQIDEVTPATIHRGALPIIEDAKLIEGSTPPAADEKTQQE